MDTRTGEVMTVEMARERIVHKPSEAQWLKEIPYQPKMKKKIGRNDKCPCGSGRKFKRCCLMKKVLKEEQIKVEK